MHTSEATPLALFRSTTQLNVLAELYRDDAAPVTISELAALVGADRSTVQREIARLESAGIASSYKRGQMRFVSANPELPWAGALRTLVDAASR